jgi:hypothetical protein
MVEWLLKVEAYVWPFYTSRKRNGECFLRNMHGARKWRKQFQRTPTKNAKPSASEICQNEHQQKCQNERQREQELQMQFKL